MSAELLTLFSEPKPVKGFKTVARRLIQLDGVYDESRRDFWVKKGVNPEEILWIGYSNKETAYARNELCVVGDSKRKWSIALANAILDEGERMREKLGINDGWG